MAQNSWSMWSDLSGGDWESMNYSGLAGRVLRTSHKIVESPFGPQTTFDRVIEVGAGSGIHITYVRHAFREYLMTDSSAGMLEHIPRERRLPGVQLRQMDAAQLDVPNASYDRLIATHILEHVPNPDLVIQEWARVVRPGGVLSIVLPCDPGLAWRLGRSLGPRAASQRQGIDYDYIMALEHINAITNLVAIICHHFPQRRETWWPLRVPFSDLNLIYAANITKPI